MPIVAIAAVAFAIVLCPASSSAAVITNELTRFGSYGVEAGQFRDPGGIATDPATGHVFVAEEGRIDEFTPWGEFVKAFGWGVAPGPVDEEQEVRIRASAGQFKLGLGASTTADLPFDASAGEVEAALNGLTSLQPGASISVRSIPGNTSGSTPYIYVVAFSGSLAGVDVEQLSVESGTAPPAGGSPTTGLEVRTRANGSPGGSGLESCTTASGCAGGTGGSGAGQLAGDPTGIAVGPNGDIYVRDREGNRIEAFSTAGVFLFTFGGEVDKTQVHLREAEVAKGETVTVTPADENLCTAASGDECGAGTVGTAPGAFSGGRGISIDSSGAIYVGDRERIQVFQPDGGYKSEILLNGRVVVGLAVDPTSGSIYVLFGSGPGGEGLGGSIDKLSPSGTTEATLPLHTSALAVDPSGDVYATEQAGEEAGEKRQERILEFDSAGHLIASFGDVEPSGIPGNYFSIEGLGSNAEGDLYASYYSAITNGSVVRAFGPAPNGFESPVRVAPTIVGQYASAVDTDSAVLKAEINPRFWQDTSYYLEYGLANCAEGPCSVQPAAPGTLLTSAVTDLSVTSAGILLSGLEPGTTYHYRFVTQSSGGGPVVGPDRTFRTFPPQSPPAGGCSNEGLRTGPAAVLPDCRGYEMVSPIDKDNGDILALLSFENTSTARDQSASDGEAITYSSYRSFGGSKASPFANQYIARRDPAAGWASEAISPPQGHAQNFGLKLQSDYYTFTPDLSSAWLLLAGEPPPAPAAPAGFPNIFRRENASGGFEAVTTTENTGFLPELQGYSADGSKSIFSVAEKLTPDATSGVTQLYEAASEQLHLVCVLPSGAPSNGNCSAGTAQKGANAVINHTASVEHAISNVGDAIYWTDSGAVKGGPGKVYLRENPDREQSVVSAGECTEAAKACTLPVSATASTKAARFLGARADGAEALFTVTEGALAGSLYLYEREAGASERIAGKTVGLLGASEDLSYIYFISEEAISGTTGAIAGEPNLYLDHEGEYAFIATLTATDTHGADKGVASDSAFEPYFKAARVSADGRHIAFISTGSLTGYDNLDQVTGKPDSEVYTYEAGAGALVCVSCNPSGARPLGREVQFYETEGILPIAATIPVAESQLYTPRVLSADGSRLFFDSFDALVPGDTNGKEDVYEWEAAGAGGCDEADPSYSASNRGCISLISPGESSADSQFVDASLNGDDVFFTTSASLVAADPGLVDLYDARVGGGFATPASRIACEGEACQNPPAPPTDVTPGSLTFSGSGDLLAPAPVSATGSKPKSRALTRAQKLALVLRSCRGKSRRQRVGCEARARKRFSAGKRPGRQARRGAHKTTKGGK